MPAQPKPLPARSETAPTTSGASPHRVVALGFPRLQTLDLVGPCEVFATASRLLGSGGYELQVVSAAPIITSSGFELGSLPLARARGPIDTLVVAGGQGVRAAAQDDELLAWLRDAAARSRRVTSVCTGAMLLAETGLLDGKSATTHWASCQRLAERYPKVRVEPDRIFVRDGNVWTSAGVTAGMDLALALVEDDFGHELALETARWMVLFAKRPGGQAQFSGALALQRAEREPLREVQDWIAHNLEGDLGVERLAERTGMSVRGFARAFRREVGITPGSYVESMRVEHARAVLEATGVKVEAVARSSGFGTPETMRRAFSRRLGVSPGEYRARFAALDPNPRAEVTR